MLILNYNSKIFWEPATCTSISSFRLFNIVAYYGASPINSSSTPLPAKPILKTQGQKIILLKTNNYYQYCMKMLAFLITASEAFNGSRIEFSISGQSQSCWSDSNSLVTECSTFLCNYWQFINNQCCFWAWEWHCSFSVLHFTTTHSEKCQWSFSASLSDRKWNTRTTRASGTRIVKAMQAACFHFYIP